MLTLRLPQFEGPLELLLHLIERRELEITAISLASVADQFLAQLEAPSALDSAALADFVAMGARLVLIKSRALLPRPAALSRSEEDEIDDAEALAQQLRAYRQARATAVALAERQATGQRTYTRPPNSRPQRPPVLAAVGLADLTRALRRRLLELPVTLTAAELTPQISLASRLALIESELARWGQTHLHGLLARATSRAEVIVTFIAVLELMRRGRIVAVQTDLFGDIKIRPWRPPANQEPTNV